MFRAASRSEISPEGFKSMGPTRSVSERGGCRFPSTWSTYCNISNPFGAPLYGCSASIKRVESPLSTRVLASAFINGHGGVENTSPPFFKNNFQIMQNVKLLNYFSTPLVYKNIQRILKHSDEGGALLCPETFLNARISLLNITIY